MKIDEIINKTAEKHSPYAGDLVNHLPMVQWSIYEMAKDETKAYKFTRKYLENNDIDEVGEEYRTISSLDKALGKKELYREALSFLEKETLHKSIEEIISEVVNKYKFGISSGLFHTSIRLGYAVEAYNKKPELKDEVLRSLAYYVTGYKKSKLFKRRVDPANVSDEMEELASSEYINHILQENDSLGQRIKALYENKSFLDNAFIIEGSKDEKLKSLLDMLVNLYYRYSNIVVLHCITGIDAIIKLEEYFEDYDEAVDILTTSIITHLITTGIKRYPVKVLSKTGFSWTCLKEKALKSKDIHDIKFTYSCCRLNKIFDIELLKDISLKRIKHI